MKMKERVKNKYGFGWIYAQTKGNRRYLIFLTLAGIALAAANMGVASVLKQFVDIAVGDTHILLSQNVLAALTVFVLEGSSRMVTSVSYQVSCNRIGQKIRMDLTGHLYRSSLLEMQKYHVGEYMTNLTADVEKVSGCLPSLVHNTVGNGLSAVFAILYLFYLNWKLALIMLICIPLLIFCIAVFSPIVQKTSRTDKENEENIRVYFQDVLEKIALFKIGFMEKKLETKTYDLLENKVHSARKLGAAEGGSAFLNSVMGTVMYLIALGGGAFFVMRGEMEVGAMIAVIQLSNYIIWPFTAIGDIISNVNQSIVSAERLERIYSLAEEPKQEAAPKKEVSCLRLKDVSFNYGDTCILKEINAEFKRKQIIGIIGESGGGKSTLLKVASGLYLPEKGEVTAVFSDGSSWNNVRPYVGLVPSADLIFRDTIEANICMAMEPDRERLEKCAAMVNISRYIEDQQKRYDTVIGDGKQALSSGQEQRIGIARTLYQGADILLFDEPTANLDAESIDVFLDTLDQVASERICIVVTHDSRVVERCSQVFEVTEGGLIARHI